MNHTIFPIKMSGRLIIAGFILALLTFSCQESWQPEVQQDPAIKRILDLGFDESEIEDLGTYYAVGDMLFEKKSPSILSPRSQQYSGVEVFSGLRDHITVTIDPSIPNSGPNNWRPEILLAINDWNSVPDCMIKFALVNDPDADITVRAATVSDNLSITWAAAAVLASGAPGSRIMINFLNYTGNPNSAKKRNIMVHEFGHTIALAHTNLTDEEHIPGTPTTDNNSVMLSYAASIDWAGFSAGDILAVQTLYPEKEDDYLVSEVNGTAFLSIRRGHVLHHDIDMDGNVNLVQEFGPFYAQFDHDEFFTADWSGNGHSTLATRQGTTFQIDMNGDTEFDTSYPIIGPGALDLFFVGDWNGDGKHTVAYKRRNGYSFDDNGDGHIDRKFVLNQIGSQILVGDWNNDGKSTIAIRDNNVFHFDLTGNGVIDNSYSFGYGNSEDQYLAGDWNGDGKTTLAIRRDNAIHIDATGNRYVNYVMYLGFGS